MNVRSMNTPKRFIAEFFKYKDYLFHFVKALETVRVSNTILGYFWWFLDPLLNMGIYVILVRVVFSQRDPNFPVFFFSAMLVWRYFSMTVTQAATSIISYTHICRDTYIPKFIFPFALTISGIYPFFVSVGILFVLMFLFNVAFTIYLLYLPLLALLLLLFTFLCSIIVAHITAFINDFENILPHLLTLLMFSTPIFYDISRIPPQYQFLFKLNPLTILTGAFRNVITYGKPPNILALLFLFLFTVLGLFFGLKILYRYDQVYNRISPK
ncbi:MAG: ABC transporter permease [Brevinema sp.]